MAMKPSILTFKTSKSEFPMKKTCQPKEDKLIPSYHKFTKMNSQREALRPLKKAKLHYEKTQYGKTWKLEASTSSQTKKSSASSKFLTPSRKTVSGKTDSRRPRRLVRKSAIYVQLRFREYKGWCKLCMRTINESWKSIRSCSLLTSRRNGITTWKTMSRLRLCPWRNWSRSTYRILKIWVAI